MALESLNRFGTEVWEATAADWTQSGEILPRDTFGKETDTGKIKLGDGATEWNSLSYIGGGGGGSWEKVSYQNSAMSVAVDCYIQYAADGTTPAAVYEPIRNNYVSCSQFAYADSIDKVPFDNVNWYDNTISDVKLSNLSNDAKIKGCILSTMVIDTNNSTGFQLTSHTHQGIYGNAPNNAELFINGNNVTIQSCTLQSGAFINNAGNSNTYNCLFIEAQGGVYANSKVGLSIQFAQIGSEANLDCQKDNGSVFDLKMHASSYCILGSGTFQYLGMGASTTLGTFANKFAFHNVNSVDIASGSSITTTTDDNVDLQKTNLMVAGLTVNFSASQADITIIDIAGTAYQLGVDGGGNVTAVAI